MNYLENKDYDSDENIYMKNFIRKVILDNGCFILNTDDDLIIIDEKNIEEFFKKWVKK